MGQVPARPYRRVDLEAARGAAITEPRARELIRTDLEERVQVLESVGCGGTPEESERRVRHLAAVLRAATAEVRLERRGGVVVEEYGVQGSLSLPARTMVHQNGSGQVQSATRAAAVPLGLTAWVSRFEGVEGRPSRWWQLGDGDLSVDALCSLLVGPLGYLESAAN